MNISVVVPMYNVENYIIQCLESISEQLEHDDEIIIIDDGSTDCSYQKAIDFKNNFKKNKVIILKQENSGQATARNVGMSCATGDYIWFIDSDDIISEDSLSIIKNTASENNYPDIIAFEGDYFIDSMSEDVNFNALRYNRPFINDLVSQKTFFEKSIRDKCYFVQPCHYVFKRNLYPAIKYVDGIIYEDNIFTTEIFCLGDRKIKVINSPLYKRRIREGSTITSKFTNKNVASFLYIVNYFFKNREQYKQYINLVDLDNFISTMLDSYFVALLRVDKKIQARRIIMLVKALLFSYRVVKLRTLILAFIPRFLYLKKHNRVGIKKVH